LHTDTRGQEEEEDEERRAFGENFDSLNGKHRLFIEKIPS
jgi:hypothetical protein